MTTVNNAIKTLRAPKKRTSASITAANQFTTVLGATTTQAASGTAGINLYGEFLVELSGTWSANVYAQRSIDNGTTWTNVTTGINATTEVIMTNNGQRVFNEVSRDVLWRFGCPAANFTSGTVLISIQQ